MKKLIALVLTLLLLAPAALAEYTEYKLNDYHENIKKIQQRLVGLKYLDGRPDGWFGQKTKSALKRFQLVNGLPDTGVADAASQEALFSDDAKKSVQVLMSLSELKRIMSENTRLGVKYDLSEMVVDKSSATVEMNNYVVMHCELLGDDVTEIMLVGKDNVKIPFTMLLAALDDSVGAGNIFSALDELIGQQERAVDGMRIRYEVDDKKLQRLMVTPLEEDTADTKE